MKVLKRTITDEKEINVDAYRKEKIKTMKDFCVTLTEEETAHLETLTSARSIQTYCMNILAKRGW